MSGWIVRRHLPVVDRNPGDWFVPGIERLVTVIRTAENSHESLSVSLRSRV